MNKRSWKGGIELKIKLYTGWGKDNLVRRLTKANDQDSSGSQRSSQTPTYWGLKSGLGASG